MKRVPRTSLPRDLLHGVHGSEINWEYAALRLQGMRRGAMPFVYFIAEPDPGYVKIGTAVDPVKRLRELQTGNPRRLRIERVIYGNAEHERVLHAYFRGWMAEGKRQATTFKPTHAKDTEWFAPEARERLLEAADRIWDCQCDLGSENGALTVQQLHEAVGEAMTELGYELRQQDVTRLLGRTSGYVKVGLGL